MSIVVLSPGFYSSIQDSGRYGYAAYGVPESGAMDKYSARFANLMLNNKASDAVLEIAVKGPLLKFEVFTSFCIAGLQADLSLNGFPIQINKKYLAGPEDILEIGRVRSGVRVYLAVTGGFKNKKILGSRSYYFPVTGKMRLGKNDQLPITTVNSNPSQSHAAPVYGACSYRTKYLSVRPGPEWNKLPPTLAEQLFQNEFTISSKNSRMAYQLQEKIPHTLPGIITQPVVPGTVQFIPAGNLIILTRDCQTTGGYPRIFQVEEKSLSGLGQKQTGDKIKFRWAQDYELD